MNRERLKETLMRHEGVIAKPYQDSVGVWTVGIGRNMNNPFRQSEMEFMLQNDINDCEAELRSEFAFFENLNDARQEVLLNMNFNLGLNRLKGFKRMLVALSQEDYVKAAEEMLDSKWAVQVKGRSIELSEAMRTGKFPKGD